MLRPYKGKQQRGDGMDRAAERDFWGTAVHRGAALVAGGWARTARGGTDRARAWRAAGGDEQRALPATGGAFASPCGECDSHGRAADDGSGSRNYERRGVVQVSGRDAAAVSGASRNFARDAEDCGLLPPGTRVGEADPSRMSCARG